MSATAATRLMHAVLDGEATPAEALELEGLLEADPALRERYVEWQAMFDAMQRMPQAYPPEGLVAAVMANIPHSPGRAGEPTLGALARNWRNFRSTPGHPGNVGTHPPVTPGDGTSRGNDERSTGTSFQ
ncbi:MAG: hypothetical protein IPF73_12500 [Betaproteobacteria bacterium]|nr:hypothetical protein [Betaproteobacteria bacterium]